MRATFRSKLTAIVGSAALSFLLMIGVGTWTSARVSSQLTTIQQEMLPRLELQPRLETDFEKLQRAIQDAVAASDYDQLEKTSLLKEAALNHLAQVDAIVDPREARQFRDALEEYYFAATSLSRRLIAGETGEDVVSAMGTMQAKQARAIELLRKVSAFDRSELITAFKETKEAQTTATLARLAIAVACLLFVLVLSRWLTRGVLRSLQQLSAGFARFGRGEFESTIHVDTDDELAEVALRANQMARNLRTLALERDHADWLKAGYALLTQELRGELEPSEVASRALRVLARYMDAPVGAFYLLNDDAVLQPIARYGYAASERASSAFRLGEGLLGEAARGDEIAVIHGPPADYVRVVSAVGSAAPRVLVFIPILHLGATIGVIELAFFREWSSNDLELVRSLRETVAIAIAVARARSATRSLLAQTQQQAIRLSTQEEELRATNEELQTQQEELRQTNQELGAQATELEAQRQALEERNEELVRARLDLENKAEELANVSAYKSQFLANMSHELRTPLNSMLLLSNLLAENEEKLLSPRQVEFARTIHAAGKDLLALINQVLDLAKVEAGRQEVHLDKVSLRDLSDYAKRVFTPLAEDKGLRFRTEIAEDLPETIATDRQRVSQVLTNLLGNAIKFTEHGEVTLRVCKPNPSTAFRRKDLDRNKTVAFEISDTGLGIALEHQDRIFTPFEQLDAASDRRYGGTGLGLSIAREFATLLRGELHLRSTKGEGSTFTLYVPYEYRKPGEKARPETDLDPNQEPETQDLAIAVSARSDNGENGLPRSPKEIRDDRMTIQPGDSYLLVIEDDAVFAQILGDVIHRQGLKYIAVTNGRSGLRHAREKKPSGVILDVRLPDIDGWVVMQEMQRDAGLENVPVHIVSAVNASERGFAMGAIGYLTKPANRDDLDNVVEALVPRFGEKKRRVLIVESDTNDGESLAEQVRGEKLETQRVSTAREALTVLEKQTISLLIVDLSLSDMDGLDFLKSIQEQKGDSAPSVLVYTARALSKAEAERLEAYADAVVLREGSSSERLLDEIRLFVRRLDEGQGTRRPIPQRAYPNVNLEGKKVLLADDDMRTAYALSATLRAKGMQVLVADTGRAALDVLKSNPDVEAVLMDIMMPEMDGYEATKRIRQDERFRNLPIIALTAKAMKGDKEKCLEVGATDYLPKPVDAAILLGILQQRLSSASGHGN